MSPILFNVKRGSSACAYCAGKKVHPDDAVAAMCAADLEPQEPYPGSQKPWRCLCVACGRDVSPTLNSIRAGCGCRYCGHGRTANALRSDAGQAAGTMRDADLEPLAPYPGAKVKWRCRCTRCDREVTPRYFDVRRGHSGCKWCASRARGAKQREGMVVTAVNLMTARGLELLEPYPGSQAPWRCRCTQCGSIVTPRYCNVKQGQSPCRSCSFAATGTMRRTPGQDAVVTLREAGFEPIEPYEGADTPWRSRCRACDNESWPRLSNVKNGSGCRWCARNAVDPITAETVMRAAGFTPLAPYPGTHTPWRCRCQHCHLVVTPRYHGVRRGTGCGGCKHAAVSEAAAFLMMEARLEPLAPYPGSNRKWTCRCLGCGKTVYPFYYTIQRGGGGCRACASSGFKAGERSTVYLLGNNGLGALKIGITDCSGLRLSLHQRRGWSPICTVETPGDRALFIEKNILRWWRVELSLPPFLGRQEMPQGGQSETVELDMINIPATIERIKQLAAT